MSSEPVARRKGAWPLLVLNLVLVLLLGIVSFNPDAIGQFKPGGQTLAISTTTGNGNEQLMWMFDTNSMRLVVTGWDRTGSALIPLDHRDVSEDVTKLRKSR